MSTGNINLDLILNSIKNSAPISPTESSSSTELIMKRYPSLSSKEAAEIGLLISTALLSSDTIHSDLVVTAPPSFSIKAKSTANTVATMIAGAQKSILLTGYSLSEYFDNMVDCMIQKSRSGVLVKFFANGLDGQQEYEKLLRHRSKFLRIYNYQRPDDPMSSLHAKVICVDQTKTLITSANLSYHGQQGNIEMGTYIESSTIALQVESLFTNFLFSKVFSELR